MKFSIKIFLFLIILITISGCLQNKAEFEAGVEINSTVKDFHELAGNVFIDDFGYAVRINGTPERIVSLAPSNTEILFALGVGDRVIAVTDYCNFPPEAKEKTKIGGYSTINIEKVISLNPDLVVAAYGNGRETVEFLRRYVPVIALNPKNLTEVMRDIELLGKITNTEENASRIISMMEEKIEEVKRNRTNKRVRVAHILWFDPIWVSGKNTFIDEIITIAGGENVFDFEGWRVVSEEDLIKEDPDVIIVNGGTGMGKGRNIIYNEVMNLKLRAVEKGRVYIIDPDIISRPSYRLVYALENLSYYFSK